MKADAVYVVGLRLDPDRLEPELYTLWFEYDGGESRAAARSGRLQWVFSATDVDLVRDDDYDLGAGRVHSMDDSVVCDVATVLYAVQRGAGDNDLEVLNSINMLDDFLIAVANPLPDEPQRLLGTMRVGLTEGESLGQVVPPPARKATIDAVFASLGRVLAFSDFLRR